MKQFFLSLILLFAVTFFHAQECMVQKNPNQLVYDATGTLSPTEIAQFETQLQQFAKESSNQFVIIVTNDLCGYEPADYAFKIIDDWGIGQADLDNGLVILIKPKTGNQKGQAFIATGRGLEGIIPDGKIHLIWESEMIPAFKKNQYGAGIQNALNVLKSLAKQEYNFDTYAKQRKKKEDKGGWIGLIIFGLVFLFMIFGKARGAATRNNIPFWTAFWLMNSGPRRGYWDDFNGGSGSSWGGGGGFGGFGGGSSGGGGSGGSW